VPGTAAGADPHDRQTFDRALTALRQDEAIVLPTDTVYGVAVLLSTPGAARVLSKLKARSSEQPLAVLVASAEQAGSLVDEPTAAARRLMDAFWPGPMTLVLPRRAELSDLELGGDGSTIGVRCPAHPFVRELARQLGPIVTTSANRHGEATPASASEAAGALAGPVAVVVEGGILDGLPSTVVDCLTDPPVVVREGAVTTAQVSAAVQAGA
jgi:tRNA threonylcarbamoyl adenosine modification protein (Sua5/YciO/YrdC/YwlC family)